jgi:hypothetical protein
MQRNDHVRRTVRLLVPRTIIFSLDTRSGEKTALNNTRNCIRHLQNLCFFSLSIDSARL